MNRPISLLIKRSKGLSEVVKGKHSAHRLNRCNIGYVQYPDNLIFLTGVGISAGAGVFFYFLSMYTRNSYLCYVLTLEVCLPIEVFRLMICVDCSVGARVSCVVSLWGCWQFGCSSAAWNCRWIKLCRLRLSLHIILGASSLPPTLHQGTRRWMKMSDWIRTDCASCCSTLRKASVTGMIFPLSLSV